MPIVDAHCHIYPEKIAAKAVQSVGEFYTIEMDGDGTTTRLNQFMEEAGITTAIVHSVAVKPQTVTSINDFIIESCKENPSYVGFMTMHPDFEDPQAEIDRCKAAGLRGMKIHPDTQYVNADDPRMMEIYGMLEDADLSIIFHAGDYRYDYSHPRRIKNICRTFPKLKVNAAHFGGWSVPDLALEYMEDESCFMDCSSSFRFMGRRRAKELIRIYGADRILFGSDFPMWEPQAELEFLRSLELDDAEMEKILWRNAERFVEMDLH